MWCEGVCGYSGAFLGRSEWLKPVGGWLLSHVKCFCDIFKSFLYTKGCGLVVMLLVVLLQACYSSPAAAGGYSSDSSSSSSF
jgi:hypothetical protein